MYLCEYVCFVYVLYHVSAYILCKYLLIEPFSAFLLRFMILFASPLVAVKNVIATKSADSIPLPFTVAGLINCSLWSIVGLLLLNDFNLYFPSMMGLVCALLQLFLKGIYGGNDVDSSTVEMNKIHSV